MLSEAQDGPLWYRGLAQNPETEEAAHVDAVLALSCPALMEKC